MTAQPSRQLGTAAEELAVHYLSEQGYEVIERNYRARGGEIDVVAWDDDILCFIEVRSRRTNDHGDPLDTIDRRKIARIVKAARQYLTQLDGVWPQMRFDAVGITLQPQTAIRLIKDAFEA